MGNYLTAGLDFDVSGKNWAWALKWVGPAQDGAAGRHAALTQRRSAEIVRRNRVQNPQLAGLMQFVLGAPYFFCGEAVRSFADLAHRPTPQLEAASRSFAPVLLSIESWSPHAYAGSSVPLRFHVVNDDDAGAPLGATTLSWRLTCEGRCAPTAMLLGKLAMGALPYYGAQRGGMFSSGRGSLALRGPLLERSSGAARAEPKSPVPPAWCRG